MEAIFRVIWEHISRNNTYLKVLLRETQVQLAVIHPHDVHNPSERSRAELAEDATTPTFETGNVSHFIPLAQLVENIFVAQYLCHIPTFLRQRLKLPLGGSWETILTDEAEGVSNNFMVIYCKTC